MSFKINNKTGYYLDKYASLVIAITPILSPYTLYGIPVTLLMGIVLILWVLITYKTLVICIKKTYISLIIYVLITALLSINGFFVLNSINNIFNAVFMMIVSLIIYIIAWDCSNIQQTIKYADVLGYICCIYVVYQFFMMITGNTVPLGKLPFFDINTSWIPELWGFRFNSFFSEPSYFAIYLLPLFTYHLIYSNWFQIILFGVFIILSSSSLGIISMCIVVVWHIIFGHYNKSMKGKYILIIILTLSIGYFILNKVPTLEIMIERTINKILDIRNGEGDSIRILGHLKYYEILPMKEKILGVGVSQLQNYFSQIGYNLSNYSNSFILTLINSGLIGLCVLMGYLIDILWKSIKSRSLLFFIITILVMGTDSILIGYRFYWLIYFIYFFTQNDQNEL